MKLTILLLQVTLPIYFERFDLGLAKAYLVSTTFYLVSNSATFNANSKEKC